MAWCCRPVLMGRVPVSSVFHCVDSIIVQNSIRETQSRHVCTAVNTVPASPSVGDECKSLRSRTPGPLHRSILVSHYSTLTHNGKDDKKHTGYDIHSIQSILGKYEGGSVDLEKDESSGIAVVTLNRPEKRNAVSGKMMVDLANIVEELEHWSQGKGLILQGQGNFFCPGADLAMVQESFKDHNFCNMMTNLMHDVTTRLLALPMVSVALIEGGALGGGAELTTCCDFRLATESSQIGFIHLPLGVIPGWGGTTRLTKILGRTAALDVLCGGQLLTSSSALEIGLVNSIILNSDRSLQEAKEWLSMYTQWDVKAVQAAKQVIDTASNGSSSESLANERRCFSNVWGSPTHREAIHQSRQGKQK